MRMSTGSAELSTRICWLQVLHSRDPIWLLWRLAPEASLKGRRNIETRLLELSETRLRPFLERAELIGELAELSEETFRERLLRFRCYLAEPDDPSEELLNKLRLVIPIVHTLSRFLMDEMSLLELKHGLRPLRKSLALHAPELHTLLYDMAEQMSLVGENSPEDAGKWRKKCSNAVRCGSRAFTPTGTRCWGRKTSSDNTNRGFK